MINRTTLNSFSTSLASTKVKILAFTLAYAVAVLLYRVTFTGEPIWDDMTFWFYDPVMSPEFSHFEIWRKFTWPLSVSAQKVLMQLGDNNWLFYHCLNFGLHCFNAWLVYRLMRLLRFRYLHAFLGFLFFLYQPASVVTVAWMIQFKTLLCFTLGLSALFVYLRAKGLRDQVLANILFLLSVLSKSSSLPLPFVLLFFLGKSWRTKKLLTLIPFFLTMSFGLYRITHSELTIEGIKNASKVAAKHIQEGPKETPEPPKEEPAPKFETVKPVEKTVATPEPVRIFKPLPDEPLVNETPAPEVAKVEEPVKHPEVPVNIPESPKKKFSLPSIDFKPYLDHGKLFLKTLYYYFWQSFLPVDNSPVKGLNPFHPGAIEYIHLLFLLIVTAAVWGTPLFVMLVSAHLFLLPYLGLVPAPFMLVTWVSDQHLYLALPCFILFFFGVLEKLKVRLVVVPVGLLLVFFMIKTHEAAGYYKNNFTFYEASIQSNLNNIPLAYNLSVLYIAHGRNQEAADLLESIILLSRDHTYLRENRYFPYLIHVYTQLLPAKEIRK